VVGASLLFLLVLCGAGFLLRHSTPFLR
jgi:hypothetical protein